MLLEREAYLAHLLETGYTRVFVAERAAMLLHVADASLSHSADAMSARLLEDAASTWARRTGEGKGSGQKAFKAAARGWFRYLRKTVQLEVSSGENPVLMRFVESMCHDLGYAEATSRSHRSAVANFLWWVLRNGLELRSVCQTDVDEFVRQRKAIGSSPRTIVNELSSLRAFFRFAEASGLSECNLSRTIRAPRMQRVRFGAAPCPSWKQVRSMLDALDPADPSECRAKAILLLASVYGLRRSEIVRLTLDDFDWENKTFSVRRAKRGRSQTFPIQDELSAAVALYLGTVRPSSAHRSLFLTLHAPHRPATNPGPAMRKIINSKGSFERSWGLHALRHACATELLRTGTSLKGIADFLGHRGLQSVSIYAHCGIESLRRVADFDLGDVL